MASYNRVILMGNLTRDPELKRFRARRWCAISHWRSTAGGKDTDGADREEVLFIDCAAFGKSGQT